MNLYEAVYARKSVRCFAKEAVSGKTIESIRKFYQEMEGLFGGIETELVILENRKEKRSFMGFASVKAPYYLALYTSNQEKCMMNAGYVMQQLALYVCSRGLGS